jgi:hypothetical protein
VTGSPFEACLCCVCGTVSLERDWTYWQNWDAEDVILGLDQPAPEGADPEMLRQGWRPSLDGEGDPMMLCPACKWEHRDSDDGSGVYQGTVAEMELQREADLPDMGDAWAERLVEARETKWITRARNLLQVAYGEADPAEMDDYPFPGEEPSLAGCICPPELLTRGGHKGRCPVHGTRGG